ncbi:hypothetical protein KI387_007450, partial [Taxus chinensis]
QAASIIISNNLQAGPDALVYTLKRWNCTMSEQEKMVLVDMHSKPGQPWEYCPRTTLRRIATKLEEEFGLVVNAGFESEFYLLRREGDNKWVGIDSTPYCSTAAFDAVAPIMLQVLKALQSMHISTEQKIAFQLAEINQSMLRQLRTLFKVESRVSWAWELQTFAVQKNFELQSRFPVFMLDLYADFAFMFELEFKSHMSSELLMMETTAVWKDFDTAEHAKQGDVTTVFEKEDKDDPNEEEGSIDMILFGFKLFHLISTGSKLWEHYNIVVKAGEYADKIKRYNLQQRQVQFLQLHQDVKGTIALQERLRAYIFVTPVTYLG